MKKLILLTLAVYRLQAGDSLHLATQTASASLNAATFEEVDARHEFFIHDWSGRPYLFSSAPSGLVAYFNGDLVSIGLYNGFVVGNTDNFSIPVTGLSGVYVRYQHDVTGQLGTPLTEYLQACDTSGNVIYSHSYTYLSENPHINGDTETIGGEFDANPKEVNFAFRRIYKGAGSLVALNAQCPVTHPEAGLSTGLTNHWKFDNSLVATTGAADFTISSGSASYVSTLAYQVNPVSRIKVNAKVWGDLAGSFKVDSYPQSGIDGSASFSQADSSSVVTCHWAQLSGPATLSFDDADDCEPSITAGLAFGDYELELTVTDVDDNEGTSSAHNGAVAYDANGIVIQSDPNVTKIFGPMVAFGQNPWGYMDERQYYMSLARKAVYETTDQFGYSLANPSFKHTGTGTISYYFAGLGPPPGHGGTTLCQAIASATTNTITVCDASQLDLSSLPTRILIGDSIGPESGTVYTYQEEVRIISYVGNVLTVAYDGRGQLMGGGSQGYTSRPAQAWPIGTQVGQYKVKGTGTSFLTDSATPVCPTGVGNVGFSIYSTGTATLTANSLIVRGSGTSWGAPGGPLVDSNRSFITTRVIRANATHSGSSFVFSAPVQVKSTTLAQSITLNASPQSVEVADSSIFTVGVYAYLLSDYERVTVTAIADSTHITAVFSRNHANGAALWSDDTLVISRVFPADADTGSYTYTILQYRFPVLHYTRADGSDGNVLVSGTGCESETAFYALTSHDYPGSINSTYFTSQKYSFVDSIGYQSAFGPNFYGEGLAHRSLYYRSGLASALTAANEMDENWIVSPELDGGYGQGAWLTAGGGDIGAIADLVLNSSTTLIWKDVRHLFDLGALNIVTPCDGNDAREIGYSGAVLALGALYDPDPTYQATWKADLSLMYARDNTCKGSGTALKTNSWATGFYWNSAGPKMDVTNGSATVTAHSGSSFANLNGGSEGCHGNGTVSLSVVNGTGAVTAASGLNVCLDSSHPCKISITGTTDSGATPLTAVYEFRGVDATHGILGGKWPGDSGTFPALKTDGLAYWDWLFVIAKSTDASDPNSGINKNYECTWVSNSEITLDRPWEGPTDTTGAFSPYRYALAGYGQQPYMLGIKTQQMRWSSLADIPEASSYATLAASAAQWIKDYGYDPATQGLYYGRIFQECEPADAEPAAANNGFTWKTPNCSYSIYYPSVQAGARPLSPEVGAALGVLYSAAPTAPNKTWGDTVYGSVFGKEPWTTGGVYADSSFVVDQLSDASLSNYKWPGFFFGMGMSHQWPAMRLLDSACSDLTFDPTSASVPSSGGTGTFNATVTDSACDRGVTASAGWLTCTANCTGTGSITGIGWSASSNSGSARSATLCAAGICFTVNQAAAMINTTGTSLSGATLTGGLIQ